MKDIVELLKGANIRNSDYYITILLMEEEDLEDFMSVFKKKKHIKKSEDIIMEYEKIMNEKLFSLELNKEEKESIKTIDCSLKNLEIFLNRFIDSSKILNEKAKNMASVILNDVKKKTKRTKWFGYRMDSRLLKLFSMFNINYRFLYLDEINCSKNEFEILLPILDQICFITRTKQAIISHYRYAERFTSYDLSIWRKKGYSHDELLDLTFPLKAYSSDSERRLYAGLVTNGLRFDLSF
jgi:hypothetical protein